MSVPPGDAPLDEALRRPGPKGRYVAGGAHRLPPDAPDRRLPPDAPDGRGLPSAWRSLEAPVDTAALAQGIDSLNAQPATAKKSRFIPDSRKATWLAMVFPGGGQIYNRKYWKLPLVYGGIVGCAYAINWNNKMYKDYSQAYMDIMDDDPNTDSLQGLRVSRASTSTPAWSTSKTSSSGARTPTADSATSASSA